MLNSKQVLVVDDEEISLVASQLLLKSFGYEVTLANSGEEAVELFQRNYFHYVMMDFNMPGMGGLKAVEKIRTLKKGKEAFIMGLTANKNVHLLKSALIIGMDAVYQKPITHDIINQVFEKTKNFHLFHEPRLKLTCSS